MGSGNSVERRRATADLQPMSAGQIFNPLESSDGMTSEEEE